MSERKATSYITVLDNLRRLFAGSVDPDRRPVAELYAAWGTRNEHTPDKNKIWLRNKLTAIKAFDLAVPIVSPADKQTVEYVQLTAKGKRELGKIAGKRPELPGIEPLPQSQTTEHDELESTFENFAHCLRAIQRQLPSYLINVDIKIREEE